MKFTFFLNYILLKDYLFLKRNMGLVKKTDLLVAILPMK